MDDEKEGLQDSDAAEEKDEKSISSDLIRGHINTIILRALYDGDKYGYEIIAEIERKSHGQYSLKQPSLYSALKRLEKDGYVTSYWGGSVAGGRRKYFSLTDAGKEISEQNQSEWEYSRTVIDSLISDKDFDFNNPAPSLVNMRVLRSSTSRVPAREGEDEELDYEPTFNDSLATQKLEELEAELNAKQEELQRERAELESEKARFEEEMRVRNEAALSERDWRERELEAREKTLSEERARIDELLAEQQRNAEEAETSEAERAAEDAEISERRRLLDEEEAQRKAALELEESERKSSMDAEEAARRSALDAEEAERRSALDAELAEKKAAWEAKESEQRMTEARQAEQIRIREEELAEREAFYNEERKRFSELLRQRDELLESERRAHASELALQEQRIVQEQEILFRQREKELLHRNYMELVSTPPKPAAERNDYSYYTAPEQEEPAPAPAPAPERDYRAVVAHIYAGTVERETPPADARPVDGIDFSDLESRAQYDGIKITTTGNKSFKKTEDEPETIVHKGKALFLSAIVVFCLCVIEGAILLAVQQQYGLPRYYPYLVWAIGVALLLVTGLAYANHYGKRAIRRSAPIMVNALVLYALAVIVTLIVALAVKIDFTDTSAIATYIVVPIVFFFGIVVFGLCYYLLTRPASKKK